MSESPPFPLHYSGLKDFYNTVGVGSNYNPFFGQWTLLSQPPDITYFNVILDTCKKERYNHPDITAKGLTRAAPYYIKTSDNSQLNFAQVLNEIKNGEVYVHANTVAGPYLIITTAEIAADTARLCSEAYKTYAVHDIPALRGVEPSDRQIHWIWIRKTPTWKLTNEIVLRAASWIELNPAYTFNLWTNIKDADELADFLSGLDKNIRARYFDEGRITVHFDDAFYSEINAWFLEQMPHLHDLFTRIWVSTEIQDIVMKTDYFRNILLATRGGIYADFNDLVCLAAVEPILEAHAGQFLGVTDNTTTNNASNYFMYAGKGNEEWLQIIKGCTKTLTCVYNTIHSDTICAYARKCIEDMADGLHPEFNELDTIFPDGFIQLAGKNHFIHSIIVAIYKTLGPSETTNQLRILDQKSLYGRYKPNFMAEAVRIIRADKLHILDAVNSAEFEKSWRFTVAHIYLRSIMYCSCLPVFCREQGRSIYMLPFGYLLRYSCLLSFIGHLGDGTSYGGELTKPTSIHRLMGYSV